MLVGLDLSFEVVREYIGVDVIRGPFVFLVPPGRISLPRRDVGHQQELGNARCRQRRRDVCLGGDLVDRFRSRGASLSARAFDEDCS